MITLKYIDENVVTDLRNSNVNIDDKVFDVLNTYIDIQNSNIKEIDLKSWRDAKDKTVLVADENNDVFAIYRNDKFIHNPNKIKVSDIPQYKALEVVVGGIDVLKRREQRKQDLAGYIDTQSDIQISNLPRSARFVLKNDFDVEVNRKYYHRLLQQKHLDSYAKVLDDAYDVVQTLIQYRKDETTIGKRTVYNDMIQKVVSQIRKIEDIMTAIDKSYDDVNDESLKKDLKKLGNIVSSAQTLIATEEEWIKTFGARYGRPIRPHTKIER